MSGSRDESLGLLRDEREAWDALVLIVKNLGFIRDDRWGYLVAARRSGISSGPIHTARLHRVSCALVDFARDASVTHAVQTWIDRVNAYTHCPGAQGIIFRENPAPLVLPRGAQMILEPTGETSRCQPEAQEPICKHPSKVRDRLGRRIALR